VDCPCCSSPMLRVMYSKRNPTRDPFQCPRCVDPQSWERKLLWHY
jgi:hypothetical protein